jgi:hypothetical protein
MLVVWSSLSDLEIVENDGDEGAEHQVRPCAKVRLVHTLSAGEQTHGFAKNEVVALPMMTKETKNGMATSEPQSTPA